MTHNLDIGKKGEEEAAKYLKTKGFRVIEKNYRCHWGEIDLIVVKENKLLFIEVKTRLDESYGKPFEAFTFIKKNRLSKPVQYFLLKNDYKNYKLSLDVVSITLNEDLSVKNLDHFENAGTY